MAIYVGLELVGEKDGEKFFSFFKSDGTSYGVLSVKTEVLEVVLVEQHLEGSIEFAFRCACRAIQKSAKRGAIPDKLCFAA